MFDGKKLVESLHGDNHSLTGLSEIARKYPLRKGIVASVVTLSEEIHAQLNALDIEILHVNSRTPIPIVNSYKTPETLGMDRLAAVIAANELMPQRDLLVIDAGTCITYDFVDAAGNYRGGNISPGVSMRLKALHEFTDKLPLVDSKGENPSWGDTTETAIRAGVLHGASKEIEGYILQMKKKYPMTLSVFLTGGDGVSFDIDRGNNIFMDKHLVLKGLNRILNYNDTLS